MSDNNQLPTDPRDQLQQQLLELAYDLLSDDEAAALRRRIETEPDVASAYVAAQRAAGVFAVAAKVCVPKVELAVPRRRFIALPRKRVGSDNAQFERVKSAAKLPTEVELRITRAMRRTAAIAAAVLAVFTLGSYLVGSMGLIGLDQKHLRLSVAGPGHLEAGADNVFLVSTASGSGRPVAAEVAYTLNGPNGAPIVKKQERTDADGRLTVRLRPDFGGMQWANATLEVTARGGGDQFARLESLLVAEPRGQATQLSLDKPLYQPGEVVRYRSLTLTRFGMNAVADEPVQFEIRDPADTVVPNSQATVNTEHGVGSAAFAIPATLPGGQYTLWARSPSSAFPAEKRTFVVRQYRVSQFKKDLEFTRDSYGPGDRVVADLSVLKSDGPAVGATLNVVASVDGQTVFQTTHKTNDRGAAQIDFTLPKDIRKGAGQLAVSIDDGGTRETIAKTIRIDLGRVEMSFYPEGGDLVPGVENRVYFVGRNSLEQPIHVEGRIVDSAGREVAELKTQHKGMGVVRFTPQVDEHYSLKVSKPAGVEEQPKLPDVKALGRLVLDTGAGVFDVKQPIALDLHCRMNGLPLVVAAYCRGTLVGWQAVESKTGTIHLELPMGPEVGGVVRLTVYEQPEQSASSRLKPIAERLVYRRPARKLKVVVDNHPAHFAPGSQVELSLHVTDENSKPTAAALGVSVVPDALLKMIDDEIPSMPTHFYLTSEIEKPEDLEKADFYLGDDPKAPAALDLLLGTQGWRRFAEANPDRLVQAGGGSVYRAATAQRGIDAAPVFMDNRAEVNEKYEADVNRVLAARAEMLHGVSEYVLLGGVMFALMLTFVAAWGVAGGLRFWTPTVATAAACLVAGFMWSSRNPPAEKGTEIASAIAPAPQPASNAAQHESGAPPIRISWRPQFSPMRTTDGDVQFSVTSTAFDTFSSPPPSTTLPQFSMWLPSDVISSSMWQGRDGTSYLDFGDDPHRFNSAARDAIAVLAASGSAVANKMDDSQQRYIISWQEPPMLSNSGAWTVVGNTGNNTTLSNSTYGGALTVGSGATLVVNGLVDPSGLTKTGSATLTLSSANTYSGGTGITLNGGSLRLSASNTYAGATTVNGGTVMGAYGVDNSNGLAVASGAQVGDFASTSNGVNSDAGLIGNVSGAGSVASKSGQSYPLRLADNYESKSAFEGPDGFNDRGDKNESQHSEPYQNGAHLIGGGVHRQDYAANAGDNASDPFVFDMSYNPNLIPKNVGADEAIEFPTVTQWRQLTRSRAFFHRADPTQSVSSDNPPPPIEFRQGSFNNQTEPVFVREYAHQHVSSDSDARTDFTETLYWNPLLITDADGKATIKFDLSDAVTKFRVLIDAHCLEAADGDGRIGSGTGEVVSQAAFSIEPKLPLEVTVGDRIDLPVAVMNDTEAELPVSVSVKLPTSESHEIISPTVAKQLEVDGSRAQELKIPAGERGRAYFPLHVVGTSGVAEVEVRGQAGKLTDAARQSVRIVAPGYPHAASYSGQLKGEQALTVRLPKEWIAGSLDVSVTAYPNPVATITHGLESILREPNGCFEQTSTSNYPNVLALEYMQEHQLADPDLTRRCKALLDNGYLRLTSYECKQGGFEWFGREPASEPLTAYGLMEFREMARVYPVDPQLLERTTKWLLSRRDGTGGFLRTVNSLDHIGGGNKDLTDAYIVWALSESDVTGFGKELNHAIEIGRASSNPYVIALVANAARLSRSGATSSMTNLDENAVCRELLDKLAHLQAADGHLDGLDSFTHSGGVALQIETTSLATLAWLKGPASYRENAQRAIDWIVGQRQDGGFGSTQATILALKALVEHSRVKSSAVTVGELIVKRNGQKIGGKSIAAGERRAIRIADLAGKFEPGENLLTIILTGDNEMPYSLDVRYASDVGASDPACAVQLSTKLAAKEVKAGGTIGLEAELTNATDKWQPMTIAILGLPAGLQPREKQLEDLKKAGAIDFYETRAREIVFYWRGLEPNQKIPLRLDLVAEWPGQYTAPASRAYLYYTAERKQWCEPLKVTIGR